MRSCCVENCDKKSEDIIFFEFPTSRSLRRRWLDVIKLDCKLTVHSVVCSQHFTKNDYESIRGKIRLKRKVVPTLLLGDKITEPPLTPNADLTEPTAPVTPPPDTAVKKHTDETDHKTNETENCKTNGTDRDGNSGSEESQPKRTTEEPDPKQDIEEMITNYQIKNNPNSALALAASVDEELQAAASEFHRADENDIYDVDVVDTSGDVIILPEAQPVFIEVPVDKDESQTGGDGGGCGETGDCLMLLESVQVDIDPAALLPPDQDYDDEEDKAPDKKDAISLLTSSDEDDVILEEPHVDTVEVSDETDEDDIPLTRLIRTQPKKSKKTLKTKRDKTLKMVMWGGYEYYCVQCHFTTANGGEFKSHVAGHSKVLQICAICSYTTASKTQYSRHLRKHKVEKKFRCHLCGYKARHNMSLIYHLKSHDKSNLMSAKRGFKCKKCNFKSDVKSVVLKHVKLCGSESKMFRCSECEYETARRSDLKRHRMRKHQKTASDDEEYLS